MALSKTKAGMAGSKADTLAVPKLDEPAGEPLLCLCALGAQSVPSTVVKLEAGDRACGADQESSTACKSGKYAGVWSPKDAKLSERALMIGEKVFVPIAQGTALPGPSYESAPRRVLVKDDAVLGFQGVGGKDMCRMYHLLLIPSYSVAIDRQDGPIRWAFDLTPSDLALLLRMKSAGLHFLRTNRSWFVDKYANMTGEELKGRSLDYWLSEKNVQFGFHVEPSVGYLHMHMLVGPVTDFGFEESNRKTWLPLESVLVFLATGRAMAEALVSSPRATARVLGDSAVHDQSMQSLSCTSVKG